MENIKRTEVILVRSFISDDITPPNDEYGVLLKEYIVMSNVYEIVAYNATRPLSSIPGL